MEAPAGLSAEQQRRWDEIQSQMSRPFRTNDGGFVIRNENGGVAEIRFQDDSAPKRGRHDREDPIGLATAHLVTAAHEMLAVCLRVANGECTCADGGPGFTCEVCEAKAAVAKAKGTP